MQAVHYKTKIQNGNVKLPLAAHGTQKHLRNQIDNVKKGISKLYDDIGETLTQKDQLQELVEFSNHTSPEEYVAQAPVNYGRAFSLIRLADLLRGSPA